MAEVERVEVARFRLPVGLDASIGIMRAFDNAYSLAILGPSAVIDGVRWVTILAEPPED